MEKFITFKEQELKDNLEWIKIYTESIIRLAEAKHSVSIKRHALAILKQLEDFNLST